MRPPAAAAAADSAARPARLAPEDSALVQRAARLAGAGPRLAQLWPGYWPADQPFLVTRPPDAAMLVAFAPPPAEYRHVADADVPAALRGVAYVHRPLPDGLRPSGGFHQAFEVGAWRAPALMLRFARTEARYYVGMLHEAFHGYQEQHFADTAGTRSRFGRPVVDPALVAAPEFRTLAERERQLLATALLARSDAARRTAAREYLAVRTRRLAGRPTVARAERGFELVEGTATLVGYAGGLAVTGVPADALPDSLAVVLTTEELGKPLTAFPADGPETDAQLMRWRLYGTGAAMGALLDRLGAAWRPAAERGAYLDTLLATAVDVQPRGEPSRRPVTGPATRGTRR